MKVSSCICLCLVFCLFGCAHMEQTVPETPNDAVGDVDSASGSIWSQGMANYYLDRRARNVGDIVTVKIIEESSASQEASTKTGRTSDLDAELDDTFGLPNDYGMSDFLGSGQPFKPSVKGNYKRDFNGAGTTLRKDKLTSTVSACVVEKLPGGNLRIEADREIKVNREKQHVTLSGIIRPEDIGVNNTVLSTQMANAKIRYSGRGVLGDAQGPGWFARIMDWIWPL